MKAKRNVILALATFCLAARPASAETVNAVYNSATDVPMTATNYAAAGNTVNFTLNFAPVTGTDLMVVKNVGLDFIVGAFDNLAQGQVVALSSGGTNYSFVADYYGGSGNDLVLVWANNRAFAWGNNGSGQLGNNTSTNRLTPGPVTATGVLAGKTVLAMAAGGGHSLALCSDGTVAAWGLNLDGQLGDNGVSGPSNRVPVAVNTASGISALYGKRVVAIAAGGAHNLALCSDGTLAAWGNNLHGQLGDDTSRTNRLAPVAVNTASGISALYGKRVVAIAAGSYHSLALCADGTVAAWGWNLSGQLGDNTYSDRPVPVAVNMEAGVSALYGETVVAVAAGSAYSLVLCSNGTAVAWGGGGLLGDNTATDRLVPVAVNTAAGVSALYGKTVAVVAAGYNHSLARCSDGTVAAWGDNYRGQLGDNTSLNNRLAPVAVNTAAGVSALYGKTVAAIAAGDTHSLALCSDGTLAAWGFNNSGELGDNTTTRRSAPVAVNTNLLAAGERFTRVANGPGAYHTLALVAVPPPPAEISITGNGLSITNHDSTPSTLDGTDFGTAMVGGGTVVRTFTIQNTGALPLNLTGTPKVVVSGPQAADFTVTLQPSSPVAGLTGTTTFQVTFAPSAGGTRAAMLSIASDDVDRNPYDFAIQGTGSTTLSATYTTGTEVPLTANGFTATGNSVIFILNFAPATGTDLMVVQNTGLDFIVGTFDNLTNGQLVVLTYGTTIYNFVGQLLRRQRQ